MVKKIVFMCALLLPNYLACFELIPEYPFIDCAQFTTANDADCEYHYADINDNNIPYIQHYPHHYNNTINRLTKNCDSRLAHDYALQQAQRYRHALCEQSHLPPGFKDSFKQRGTLEDIFKGDTSQNGYAQAFHKKMVSLLGPHYTQQAAACYQRAEMRQWTQYYYAGYKDFIRTLPVYDDYMLELAHEYKNNPAFAQNVRSTECRACTFIIAEEKRILAQRAQATERKKQQQKLLNHYERQAIARDIFMQQAHQLDDALDSWHEHKPRRAQAYHQTIAEQGLCRLESHEISLQAQECLRNHGYDPHSYTELHGNALQHEMLDEIIDGLRLVAIIENPYHNAPFDTMMHQTTFKIFDGARQVNEMGDCFGASMLIDLAGTVVDYSLAVAEGITEGVAQGVHDGVVGTYHMLRHPIKTAQALGKVAVCMAKMAHDYLPLQKPLWLCATQQEREAYWQKHACILKNWADVHQTMTRWWKETPSREKIRSITKGTSSLITNILVGHQCMQLASNICKFAAAETVALCRRAEHVEVAAAGVSGEMPKIVFNSMSDAEKIAEAQANTLLNEIQSYEQIAAHFTTFTESAIEEAVAYAMSDRKIEHIFENTMHKLDQLVERLGGQENTLRAVIKELNGKVSLNQIFEDIKINVAGYEVYVRGRVMDGVPKIGTFFIK